MHPPSFWSQPPIGMPALLLSPIAAVVASVSRRRAFQSGDAAGVPVFCCGNATVGGAGKTIVAIDLLQRLARRGMRPHAITRGYGGYGARSLRITAAMDARKTGDEAPLLARVAPCWVAADRAAAAREAVASGADALVMDDGLQNFSLHKDCSLLVVDGEAGFGNGLVIPAGPLREPPLQALERCRAVVLIGDDQAGVARLLRGNRPILRASLRQGVEVDTLRGRPVIAFAGIGRPAKFFDGLRRTGLDLAGRIEFPDHHVYSHADLDRLRALRDTLGTDAVLATTHKDAVRLPAEFRAETVAVGVALAWSDERIERVIDAVLGEWPL